MYTPIYCEYCGEKFGFWIAIPLVSSKDKKYLCYSCGKKLGLTDDMIDFLRKEGYLSRCSRMTYEESLAYLKEQCNKLKNDTTLTKYNFSYAPCKEIKFDDSNKVFIIPNNNIAKKEYYNSWEYVLLKYSQIVSFDLIENGSSIASGGLGRAVVGGLLFGGAGAVVGAVTRSYKELCTDLSIKITVKDYSAPAVYVHLISSGGIMKNTTQYKEYIKIAQDILSKLQIITNNVDSSTTVNTTDLPNEPIHASSSPAFSAADEILKFKKLMDEGIITQEEFDAKKKQLLGIEPAVINSAVTTFKNGYEIDDEQNNMDSTIIGDKNTFAIEYSFIDADTTEISMYHNNQNILEFERTGILYTTRWNLDEIALWLRDFINNMCDDPYPVEAEGEFAAQKDISAREFFTDDFETFDAYYNMLDEWITRHRWHPASSGAILADLYFQQIGDTVEISWNNQDAEEGIHFTTLEGGFVIDKSIFVDVINSFLNAYAEKQAS